MIWKLQMPRNQKIALACLLCVGLIAVAGMWSIMEFRLMSYSSVTAGCVRFYYVLFLANEADIWYYMADSLNWCSIEIYAGILAHCLPRSEADFCNT